MALRIPIVADVADWMRGTRTVRDDIEDLADELRDTARAGDRSADDIADSFRRMSRGVDDSLRRMEDDSRRAFRNVDDDGTRALRDLEDEARQTSAETAASFDGSWESIADGAQELLAQSSRVFGGIGGLIVGLGGGAVIGTVLTALDTWREKQQQVADAAAGYAQMILEANGYISKQITDQVVLNATQDLTAGQLDTIVGLANRLGVPWQQLVEQAVTTNQTLDAQAQLHADIEARERNRVGLTLEQGVLAGQEIDRLTEQEDLYRQMNDALGVQRRGWSDASGLAGAVAQNAANAVSPIDDASRRAATLAGHMRDAADQYDRIKPKTVTVTASFRTDVYSSTPGLPAYILRNVGVSGGWGS